MAESPLGKRRAPESELPRAVTVDLLNGQEPTDYAFRRDEQAKSVREWLCPLLLELPPPGGLRIVDVGHGMSVRHAVREESPMSCLAVFGRDSGSVRIEVRAEPPAPPLAFAPTERARLVRRIDEEMAQCRALDAADADRRDQARNSALAACPGDVDAQMSHFRREFYGGAVGERTRRSHRTGGAPQVSVSPPETRRATAETSDPTALPLGEALRAHLAELSDTAAT